VVLKALSPKETHVVQVIPLLELYLQDHANVLQVPGHLLHLLAVFAYRSVSSSTKEAYPI
jgi:hypothetical protein